MNPADLINELEGKLSQLEQIYGTEDWAIKANQRLECLVKRAYKQTGQKVVILIDEYDAPLLDVVHEKENLVELRLIMKNFYSPIKYLDPWLRFVFITGITKFSQLSIFSEINNLDNISMFDQYSAICGISKTELLNDMKPDVELLAKHLGRTLEETIGELTSYYDGYHFSDHSEDIFNPFSLVKALKNKKVSAYWFSSGTPSYLIKTLQKYHVGVMDIEQKSVGVDDFDVSPEQMTSALPLLYQSGYLTIKGYERRGKLYHLCFPNQEVRQGFSKSLVRYYTAQDMNRYDAIVYAYSKNVLINDDMGAFMPHLKAFYDKFPYTIINNNERHYQAVIFTIFTMLGEDVKVEHTTSDGRIDLVLKTDKSIFIFELKYKKSVDIAMAQISDKDYAKAFADDGRKVVKVGINFSENQRSIEDWVIE